MKYKNINQQSFSILITIFLFAISVSAQTTAFNYQGNLSNGGSPANGSYLLQFELYDAAVGGNQVGATISDVAITAVAGIFTTQLDFGDVFDGTDRFLEISVKQLPGDAYTVLSPRQQINSSPYSVKSRSADQAINAAQLGGLDASEYVTNSTVNGAFINNDTALQTGNFNINGNGFVGGTFGIGTTTPLAGYKLDVNGRTIIRPSGNLPGGIIAFGTPNGETGMTITGTNRAEVRFNDSAFSFTAGLGLGVPANRGVVINTNGEVGIATLPSAGVALDVAGAGRFITSNGNINLGTPNSETGVTFTNSNRADLRFDGTTLKLLAGTGTGVMSNTNGINITTSGNIGIGTTTPVGKLQVIGTLRTSVLQVTAGSDLAENFEFAETVIPGMVVAIDPQNAGKLIIARGDYNRRVAGIISGANNLSAGMLLPDLTENSNSNPVALSGRVWVYADATKNPIKPGDLLTTSETPGNAMKVTNHKKAKGAIIGKAMTGLESGKGLILVLVSLQ